jgi:hypothetical protein
MSYSSSKEFTPHCPIKMADGRAFTDYRPRCMVNSELLSDVHNNSMVRSSYESRMFLQENAEKLMERNRQTMLKNLAPCAPCKRPFSDQGTMYPQQYIVKCDGVSCEKIEVNPGGLGTSTRIY